MIHSVIKEAAKVIKEAGCILITTGAGMGVDSGLPDYRGNQGFWNSFPPYSKKFTFIECASPNFLSKHPNLFWGFYGMRLKLYRQSKPHDGYQILQKIAQEKQNYFSVTSNVDGHLTKYFPAKTWEVHGRISHSQCINCNNLRENSSYLPEIDLKQMSCANLPTCPKCQSVQRPNILMFGDWGWDESISSDQQQQFMEFSRKAKRQRTTIIQIGAGESLPTIRRIGQNILAANKDNRMVRINPEEQEGIKRNIISISRGALEALKQIQENY